MLNASGSYYLLVRTVLALMLKLLLAVRTVLALMFELLLGVRTILVV